MPCIGPQARSATAPSPPTIRPCRRAHGTSMPAIRYGRHHRPTRPPMPCIGPQARSATAPSPPTIHPPLKASSRTYPCPPSDAAGIIGQPTPDAPRRTASATPDRTRTGAVAAGAASAWREGKPHRHAAPACRGRRRKPQSAPRQGPGRPACADQGKKPIDNPGPAPFPPAGDKRERLLAFRVRWARRPSRHPLGRAPRICAMAKVRSGRFSV